MRLKFVFLFCLAFCLVGCVAVKKSLQEYEACKGDAVCLQAMTDSKQTAYTVTKAATGPLLPSGSEIAALLVSNVIAFGVGVFHVKKKG